MAGNLLTLTDESFEAEVLKSSLPVLVDFWAEWCGPCKQLAPVVEALATEFAGKVKFGKVDVDENPQWAGKFGIQGIPTLLLFKGGKLQKTIVGLRSKRELQTALTELAA
jgi:thioredoxin 1